MIRRKAALMMLCKGLPEGEKIPLYDVQQDLGKTNYLCLMLCCVYRLENYNPIVKKSEARGNGGSKSYQYKPIPPNAGKRQAMILSRI